jgi:superfamily II DNA or RNA helicase
MARQDRADNDTPANPFEVLRLRPDWDALNAGPLLDLFAELSKVAPLEGSVLLNEALVQFGVDGDRIAVLRSRNLADLVRLWTPTRSHPSFTRARIAKAVERLCAWRDGHTPTAIITDFPPPQPTNRNEEQVVADARQTFHRLALSHLTKRIVSTGHEAWEQFLPFLLEPPTSPYHRPVAVEDMLPRMRNLTPGAAKRMSPVEVAVNAFSNRFVHEALEGVRLFSSLPEKPAIPGARAAALAATIRKEVEMLRGMANRTMPGPEILGATKLTLDEERGEIHASVMHPLGCLRNAKCFHAVWSLDAPEMGPRTECTAGNETIALSCGTAMATMSAVLRALYQPKTAPAGLRELLNESLHVRFLRDLATSATRTEVPNDEDKGELGWLVDGHKAPQLAWVRARKRGEGYLSTLVPASDLDRYSRVLPPAEVALLLLIQRDAARMTLKQDVVALTSLLVGHPRVFLRRERSAEPLDLIEAAPVVSFEAVGNDGDFRPVVYWTAESRAEVALTRTVRPGDPIFAIVEPTLGSGGRTRAFIGFWSEAAAHACSSVFRHVTAASKEAPLVVPASARRELVDVALTAADYAPIHLERSWLGDGEAAPMRLVVRLGMQGERGARWLEIAVRVHPSDTLGAMLPADGPDILPFERDGKHGVIVRDFEAELNAVGDIVQHLSEMVAWEPEVLPFTFRIDDIGTAMMAIRGLEEVAGRGFNGIPVTIQWETKGPRTTRAARLTDLSVKIRGRARRDWLQAEGGLVVDGTELPLGELLQAIRDGKRFVEVKGDTFVEIDEALRRELEPLRAALRPGDKGALGMHALAAPLIEPLVDAGAMIDIPPEWKVRTERLHAAMALDVTPPTTLQAELRPYQVEGFAWLRRLAHWAPGAVLADDMGLGKTMQALALLLVRQGDGRALVTAPTSVVQNWRRELATFAPSLSVRIVTSGAEASSAVHGPENVVIASHDVLARNESTFAEITWATFVIDEAHAMKNSQTRRAQAARAIEAGFVLALTGTPVENRPRELWSLFRLVAPGLLASEDDFQEMFGRPIEIRRDADSARALAALVRPFILRRTKAQVATDLPPRTEIRVDVALGPRERAHYDKLRKAALADLAKKGVDRATGRPNAMRILAVLTRLRQLACHGHLVDPAHVPPTRDASAKLDRLVELVTELVAEERHVLVFSQFTEFLGLVSKALTEAALPHQQLDGSTPAARRPELIERFQRGEMPIFLLSLKAGGVGLNLTMASDVVILDPWWNPAVEDQAADRAHRIGQTRNVTIWRLVSEATIEDQILAMHGDKRTLVASLLDGTGESASLDLAALEGLLLGKDGPVG